MAVAKKIDPQLRDQASKILGELGLTMSDAVRILLIHIVKEKEFPLDLTPNALTIETLSKSERGEDVYEAKNVEDLFQQLGIWLCIFHNMLDSLKKT